MFHFIALFALIILILTGYKKKSNFFIIHPQLAVPMAPPNVPDFSNIKEPLWGDVEGMSLEKNNMDQE